MLPHLKGVDMNLLSDKEMIQELRKLAERLRDDTARHDDESRRLCNEAADAIEALQAENERLNAGWQRVNQEALQANLTVQDQAKEIVLLCDDLKYIAGIARRSGMPVDDDTLKVRAAILGAVQILEAERDALQSQLDAMGKGEPVAWQFRTNGKHWHVVQVCPPDDAYDKGTLSPLYAAPKAMAPLTDEQVYFGQWDDGSGSSADFREGARFAERHHGIGGTP